MRIVYTLVFAFCTFFVINLQAQQDPMFTKYLFNTLAYNPGFAGKYDHMYISLLHRSQWVGVEGAPVTQTFTIHSPLKTDRVGVGFSLINDVIGPTNTISANASYSYSIPLGSKYKLSVGLQGGVMNWRADWNKLNLVSDDDLAFSDGGSTSKWLPNFGAGIYFHSENFYVSFSVPHLVEYDLRENAETAIWARTYRHYFGAVGGVIPLNGKNLMLRPSILIKNVGLDSKFRKEENFQNVGAPTEFDIDLSLIFFEKFWLGTSFRSSIEAFTDETSSFDSADLWVSYFMSNGLRIGAAYDFPLTELNTVTVGSFELMLGYEFNYETNKTVTPRYF